MKAATKPPSFGIALAISNKDFAAFDAFSIAVESTPATASLNFERASPNGSSCAAKSDKLQSPVISLAIPSRNAAPVNSNNAAQRFLILLPISGVILLAPSRNGPNLSIKLDKLSAIAGRLYDNPSPSPPAMAPIISPSPRKSLTIISIPLSRKPSRLLTFLNSAPIPTTRAPRTMITPSNARAPTIASGADAPTLDNTNVTTDNESNSTDNASAVSRLGSTFRAAMIPRITARIATTPDKAYIAVNAPLDTFFTVLIILSAAASETISIDNEAAAPIERSTGSFASKYNTPARVPITKVIPARVLSEPVAYFDTLIRTANIPISADRHAVATATLAGSSCDNTIRDVASTPIITVIAMMFLNASLESLIFPLALSTSAYIPRSESTAIVAFAISFASRKLKTAIAAANINIDIDI